ncbi:hypothetical protein L4C33_11770, partial [Vibrio makurazakiensis]|uniref:hypothetical protein n=1 Tax=Vibrio makurazakiensis TaxID=2910250 RepID=UPI003D0C2FB1
LKQLDMPDYSSEILPPPPSIKSETVSNPPKINPIAKLVMKLIGMKWNRAGISFSQNDMERMLNKFWQVNSESSLLRWGLTEEETKALVTKCREKQVTVNSALWTAFLIAQREIQGDQASFRKMAGMAISTREKLTFPVGEEFGFFASSMSLKFDCNLELPFWDSARTIHKEIKEAVGKTDLFRMLVTERLPPSLLDSFYFAKYDGFQNKLATKMLKQMNWDKVSYGYSITNVGRVDIETEFGSRTIQSIYGPLLYSDVNEKVVGITTVNGQLTFSMTASTNNVSQNEMNGIRNRVMDLIFKEISGE